MPHDQCHKCEQFIDTNTIIRQKNDSYTIGTFGLLGKDHFPGRLVFEVRVIGLNSYDHEGNGCLSILQLCRHCIYDEIYLK